MKFFKILIVLFIFVLLAVGIFVFWLNKSVNTPHTHNKANQYIVIPKGSTPTEIIGKLNNEGILSSEMATLIYLRTFGDASKLKAGEYQFDSPISAAQVLQELEKGEERTTKLTIPEGFTRFDIAKRIADKFPQTPPMDDKAVLYLMDDVSLIKDLDPTAKNLEGYMYPTTYSFPKGVTTQQIIKTMVEQFKKSWKPEWNDKAKQVGKTPHEIVTMASLIGLANSTRVPSTLSNCRSYDASNGSLGTSDQTADTGSRT